MPLTKQGNLCVAVRRYKDRDTGEDRNAYETVGALFLREDGTQVFAIKRTFNPAGVPDLNGKGGDSIFLAYFPERDRDSQPQRQQRQRQEPGNARQQPPSEPTPTPYPQGAIFEDDIPF